MYKDPQIFETQNYTTTTHKMINQTKSQKIHPADMIEGRSGYQHRKIQHFYHPEP
jgi:hypothetical protein